MFNVSPAAGTTAGELLDHVLSHQDIKESYYYCIAASDAGEYLPLSGDTKISKVAPAGWKADSRSHSPPVQSFSLFLRFKLLPDEVDAFKDPNNKHQLYLQLRQDVLEGRYPLTPEKHLSLAALSLQTEFGDFSDDIHGNAYFVPGHYVPPHVIASFGGGGEAAVNVALTRLHRRHLGQSQTKTEGRFCQELQRTPSYGFHPFSVRATKKLTSLPKQHLGIHLHGLFLFETGRDRFAEHKLVAYFRWSEVTRIQYDKSRFQICSSGDDGAEKKIVVT